MEPPNTHPNLDLECSQINDNTLGGATVFLLARLGLEVGEAPATTAPDQIVILAVSLFGFLATLIIRGQTTISKASR